MKLLQLQEHLLQLPLQQFLLGAKPVFADVDLNSGCICLESIEPLINSKTKAISVVHLGGWPAEIEQICKLAKQHNLFVIEDCSQAMVQK